MESKSTEPQDVPPWLANGDPVHLDDAFVEIALPTRAHPPNSLPEPDWQAATGVVAQCLEAIDLDQTDPAIRDTVISALNRQPNEHTRAENAVLLAAVRHSGLLYAIAAENGLIDAVGTLIESLRISRIQTWDSSTRNHRFHLLNQPATQSYTRDPLDPHFEALRRMACLASDEEYAQVVAAVRAAVTQLEPVHRAAFALALPDIPDLSDALIAEFADSGAEWLPWLQATATDPELIDRARPRKRPEYGAFEYMARYVNALVVNRGSAALSTLVPHAIVDTASDALARIGLPEAIRALAGTASAGKSYQLRLGTAVDRWPAAAIAGLAQAVGDGGRDAATSRALLAGLVAKRRELAEAVRPWLTGSAASAIDSVTEQIDSHHDEATPDELPQVLADPPWLRPKRKQLVIEDLEPLPLAPVARWRDGQRESWSRRSKIRHAQPPGRSSFRRRGPKPVTGSV